MASPRQYKILYVSRKAHEAIRRIAEKDDRSITKATEVLIWSELRRRPELAETPEPAKK